MIVKYIERGKPFDHKRIDRISRASVRGKAFTQGDLIYFKRNEFEYLVIAKDDILEVI